MVRRPTSQDRPVLGVDLVEIARAKAFWRAHRSRLGSFFSDDEVAFVRRARRRACERVAVLIAAKEAAFKASGGAWMGPEGFRSIRVRPSKRPNTLACRLEGARSVSLTYSIHDKFVLARCAGTC